MRTDRLIDKVITSTQSGGEGDGVLWIAHLLPIETSSCIGELKSSLDAWIAREPKTYRAAEQLTDSIVLGWYCDRTRFKTPDVPPSNDEFFAELNEHLNYKINSTQWDVRASAVWVHIVSEAEPKTSMQWQYCTRNASWLSKLSGFYVRLNGDPHQKLPEQFWRFLTDEFFWFCVTGLKVEWMCDRYHENRYDRSQVIESLESLVSTLGADETCRIETSVERLRKIVRPIQAGQKTVADLRMYHANLVKNLMTIRGFREQAVLSEYCDATLRRELSRLSTFWQYRISQIELDLKEWRPITEQVAQLWEQLQTQAQVELVAKQQVANFEARKEANSYQAIFLFLGVVGLWAGYVSAYSNDLYNWTNAVRFLSLPALLGMVLAGWVFLRNVRNSHRTLGRRGSISQNGPSTTTKRALK